MIVCHYWYAVVINNPFLNFMRIYMIVADEKNLSTTSVG